MALTYVFVPLDFKPPVSDSAGRVSAVGAGFADRAIRLLILPLNP